MIGQPEADKNMGVPTLKVTHSLESVLYTGQGSQCHDVLALDRGVFCTLS